MTNHRENTPDDWRNLIDPIHIVDMFASHLDGKTELTKTQIEVAKALLSKVAPDLARKQLEKTEISEIRIIGGLPDHF
jgi:hypothetical protein